MNPESRHEVEENKNEISMEESMAIENTNSLKHFITQRKGLLIAALVAVVILLAPLPSPVELNGDIIPLVPAGKAMIALLAVFVILFVTEALPTGLTVALVYTWIVFLGVLSPHEAGTVFSHEAAWFLVGALMIAQVLIKYNLHKRFLGVILNIVGNKTRNLIFGMIAANAILAAFIAEHIVAAMMLPIGIAIIEMAGGFRKVPQLAKALMLSIAFGAAIGGLATPSGGGRNVVMIGFLDQFFNVQISYGSWMIMAFPITLILIPFVGLIIINLFKPERDNIADVLDTIRKEIQFKKMGLQEWMVLGIFGLVLFLWIFMNGLGIGTIALFGTLLFYIFGLARWRDYEKINWGIPLLYFGAIGMGAALIKTGAASWLGAKTIVILSAIGITNSTMLIASQSIFMSLYTQVMGDGAAVASLGPVLLESARFSGVDPVIAGVAIAISSSFAYMLVIGTPANAIVFGSGFLTAKDFLKAGALLVVVALSVLILAITFYWTGILNVGIDGFH